MAAGPKPETDGTEYQSNEQPGAGRRSDVAVIPNNAAKRKHQEDRAHDNQDILRGQIESRHLGEPALLTPGWSGGVEQRGAGLQQT